MTRVVHRVSASVVLREEVETFSTRFHLSGQPGHDTGHAMRHPTGRNGGAVDHHNWQVQRPRRRNLGDSARAARVLCNDQFGAVFPQQGRIVGNIEGPSRDDHIRVGQGQGAVRRIHEAQKIMVLRLGSKGVDVLAADGEERPPRRASKGGDSGVDVRDRGPAVAVTRNPGRALEGNERCAVCSASGKGVGAHPCCKWVGGVDHMGDPFGLKIAAKPLYPAKAAQTHVDRLARRRPGSAGVGIDAGKARPGDCLGHEVRLGRAAEQEDACHG